MRNFWNSITVSGIIVALSKMFYRKNMFIHEILQMGVSQYWLVIFAQAHENCLPSALSTKESLNGQSAKSEERYELTQSFLMQCPPKRWYPSPHELQLLCITIRLITQGQHMLNAVLKWTFKELSKTVLYVIYFSVVEWERKVFF